MNSAARAAEVSAPHPLFRKEVLDARSAQWLGSIRVARSLSRTLVTVSAVAMAAAMLSFAAWGDVARTSTVHGVLLPIGGLVNVSASQAAVVAEVLVKEGEPVVAGQPLIKLKAERITQAGDSLAITTQAMAARRASLETERRLTEQNYQQRRDALNQRVQSLVAEERQAQGELDTHRLRVELARKSVDRQQALANSGFVASAQVQQKQEELLDLQLRERNAERNLASLRRDLQTAQADRASADTQAQTSLTQLDRAIASLQQEVAEADAQKGLVLTAPQGGSVSALTLTPGQAVVPGQTLLSLVLNAGIQGRQQDLQAQLFGPSRTVGFVKPGQKVWLRYAPFPYQKFGMAEGEVISVSSSPISPQDLPNGQSQALLSAAQANEPMYRISVKLPAQSVNTYGKPTPLAAGMALDAEVRLDSRRVWEWFLEPVIAVVGGH